MFNKGARLWALGARLWAGKKGKAGILNHEIPEIRKRGRGRLNRKEHKDHRDRQGFEMADRSGFWLGVMRRRVLAPLPGCGVFGGIYRGWSLRSTPGYFLATLRVGQAVMSLLRSLKIIIGAAFSTNMSPLTGLGDGRGGEYRFQARQSSDEKLRRRLRSAGVVQGVGSRRDDLREMGRDFNAKTQRRGGAKQRQDFLMSLAGQGDGRGGDQPLGGWLLSLGSCGTLTFGFCAGAQT